MLVVFSCLAILHAPAQCVSNRDIVWNKALQLFDDTTKTLIQKRASLQNFLSAINNCPYKNDSSHALVLQLIAENYSKEFDHPNTLKYLRQAIDLVTANAGHPNINPKKLINSYYWLSTVYDSLNNHAEKMKAVNQCIAIAIQLNGTAEYACIRSLFERTRYFFDIGDYYHCIDDAAMCERLARAGLIGRTNIFFNTTMANSCLGWQVKALLQVKRYDDAEAMLRDKPDEFKAAGLENYLGTVYGQMAEVQLSKGDYKRAISYFENALACERKAGFTLNCRQIMNDLGYDIYFRHFKDNDKALSCYRQGLSYINTDKTLLKEDAAEILNTYSNIAKVYVAQKQFDTAFAWFRRAFDQVNPGATETSILHASIATIAGFKKIHYVVSLFIDKGDAYYEQYLATGNTALVQQALGIYKTADRLLDRIKDVQYEQESKLFWRSDIRRLYEHAIAACYSQKDAVTAFYFFEKSRAVLLNDQLAQQHLMKAEDVSKLAQARKKITQLQEHDSAQAKIFAAKEQYENLLTGIRNRSPLYYQSLDTSYMTLTDARNSLLHNQQTLMEIFVCNDAVYTLLVAPQQTFFNTIGKATYDNTVARYITYISNRDLLNRDFAGFRNVSYELYRLLFPPGSVVTNRIIVSPDGRYFPFESLVTANQQPEPTYFIANHAVSYTYSARYLINQFDSSSDTASYNNLLGIAPVKYAAVFRLPELAGSDESLKTIAGYIPHSTNLSWQNASRNNFLQQFPGYQIIQLYTHAADTSNRNEPVIYFADARLYLSELMTENKPVTQLVVLSACQTANGNVYQGEGVFSFNRGFAALGVPSSISNLWAVNDITTYRLTEYFYKYLSKGMPIDVALQKAKLEFYNTAKGEDKLPCYWAPAVLVGKTDPIMYKKAFPPIYIVLLVALAGILTWWIFQKKN